MSLIRYNLFYTDTEDFLFTSNYGHPLHVCNLRDSNGNDLMFCSKRDMVAAFSLLALFSSIFSIAICMVIMLKDWDNGKGIYIPAIFAMLSGKAHFTKGLA